MTRQQTRVYVLGAFLGALFIAWAVGLANDVGTTDKLREGCKRQNPRTVALYNNTVADADAREAAAGQFTGEARGTLEQIVSQGRRDARTLKRAVQPVADEPGSLVTDCALAFPMPFPVNLID